MTSFSGSTLRSEPVRLRQQQSRFAQEEIVAVLRRIDPDGPKFRRRFRDE
jgi:hypothetical protein